ncbi:HlyD family efflux transporter periplasmic adaptor subunit [Christiangramia sp.]|uniref:HlyD family secretion protein n=1 Tax=Christiangramia sp. TaxID=1931228 RepID=UPI0026397D49|nr:HlyD family efflux transporter periplasmic adaptor subunit [Christiangramia sp.]
MPQSRQQLRSEEVQDILTKVPHWMIQWGNTIVLILIILFFILAWLIKYPDIISAEAVITSKTPPQREFARVSGKMDTILVVDKQKVVQGQIMAMIENPANLKDIIFLKKIIDSLNLNGGRINLPVEQLPILELGEVAYAYSIFEKEYIDYLLNETLDPYKNKIAANQLSASELKLRLTNLENQKAITHETFQFSENELKRHKKLYEKGVISLQEYESKQLGFLENKRNLKNIDISISQLKQTLNDAYHTEKENVINNQMVETRLFKNVIQSLNQLKKTIKDWEQLYLLKSDIEGEVNFMSIWNENQTVSKGDLLFTIVPNKIENYLARIKAPIQNSGKIKSGQEVNIKLLNYPETEYGVLEGKVKNISAIPNSEGSYIVNVPLEKSLVSSYNIEIPFKNEMTGTAEIVTEDLRLIERFFYQVRGIFTN